eukprot:1146249-Pelagomonas_calceolata.AAC.3
MAVVWQWYGTGIETVLGCLELDVASREFGQHLHKIWIVVQPAHVGVATEASPVSKRSWQQGMSHVAFQAVAAVFEMVHLGDVGIVSEEITGFLVDKFRIEACVCYAFGIELVF